MKCNLFTSAKSSFPNTISVSDSRPSSGKTKGGGNKIKEGSVEKLDIVCVCVCVCVWGGGCGGWRAESVLSTGLWDESRS